jgi:acyl-CoA thioesterase I
MRTCGRLKMSWLRKTMLFCAVSVSVYGGMVHAVYAARALPVVALVGDDVVVGTGLPKGQPSFAQAFADKTKLDRMSPSTLVNISRAGETAETLVSRINEILSYRPSIVVINVGLNDALAQVDPDVIYGNLETVLNALYSSHVNILLLGVNAPSTLPDDYELKFNRIYTELASRYQIYFIPNIMDGIFFDKTNSQDSGLLPSAAGVTKIVNTVFELYRSMIKDYYTLAALCEKNPTHASCVLVSPDDGAEK